MTISLCYMAQIYDVLSNSILLYDSEILPKELKISYNICYCLQSH